MIWRYWVLSALFGSVIGIRFTVDVWVYQSLAGGAGSKFQFIGFTVAGMLIGELCAGPVSDRIGRGIAIHLSGFGILAWALLSLSAIRSGNPTLLVAGALLFGIGFGLFHSSLDAWFAEAAAARAETGTLELRLTQGYLFYNCGYLFGASLAFPLLLDFAWQTSLPTPVVDTPLFVWPYVIAIAILGAIPLTTMQRRAADKPVQVRRAALGQLVRDYGAILNSGRTGLWGVLFVAGSIALIVQLIDHLAPAVLLPGATLWDKSLNIFLFNATVCICVGALQFFLHGIGGAERISPRVRAGVVKFAICSVTLLLAVCLLSAGHAGDKRWIGFVLGLAQAILLMLPPLMKAWTLEFNVGDRYATTLAVLGVSKRLFAIVATFSLPWLSHFGGLVRPAGETMTLFAVTAAVAFITLGILIFAMPRARPAG